MKISHSAVQTYLECAYKFFLQYMLRLRPKAKTSALSYGDAIDTGLNALLESKDLSKALHSFEQRWLRYKDTGIQYTKGDLEEHLFEDNETPEAWESLRRRGVHILQEYNDQIMPLIKEVIAVQIDETVKNDQQDELVIKTDMIVVWHDGRRILFDNKTTSVAYKEDSVRTSEQLAIYFETLKDKYKLDAAGYIVIAKKVNKKKKPAVNINVIIDQIDEETFHKTLEQYDTVLDKIKSGSFEQNHKSCVGKYGPCPFLKYCHKGRDMTGLEYSTYERK